MNETHEIVFNEITEDLIQKINMRTKRAAGPSKFDADDWHRILGSNVFDNDSSELRRPLVKMTKNLYSLKLNCYENLEALLATQLIPNVSCEERSCTSSRLITSLCRSSYCRGISYSQS